jgi:hypothetical protein
MNKYLIIFNDGSTLENIITDNFSWMMESKFRIEEIKKADKYPDDEDFKTQRKYAIGQLLINCGINYNNENKDVREIKKIYF